MSNTQRIAMQYQALTLKENAKAYLNLACASEAIGNTDEANHLLDLALASEDQSRQLIAQLNSNHKVYRNE